MAGDTITRPDGRIYRSRKVIAHTVVDEDEIVCGVMVLGTHDVGRAQPLADRLAADAVGRGFVAVGPETGWWRDGFESGRRRWVRDPEGGRAAVWFREIVERSCSPAGAHVAPARYALTVLHRQDPDAGPGRDAEGDPYTGRTVCGVLMGETEIWVPVEPREGDQLCEACEGKPASDMQGTLL